MIGTAITKMTNPRESRASAIRRMLVRRLLNSDALDLEPAEALAVIWYVEYYVADKNILKCWSILADQWGPGTITEYARAAMRNPGIKSALGLYDDRGRVPAVYEFPTADELGIDQDFLNYAKRRYKLRTMGTVGAN